MKNQIKTIKAYAKINIFLKITGHKDGYHTLISRFVRVNNLYDTISLVPQKCSSFTIEGCSGVPTNSNTIYRAYRALLEERDGSRVEQFFANHKVVVEKRIPSLAGLGGGSSDGASFMRLVNDICHLNIPTDRLSYIGSKIGADLPFFIHNYSSANVSGFGEIVEPFDEEPLEIELFTPPLECDTTMVFKRFKEESLADINVDSFSGWQELKSKDILNQIKDPLLLNDLYLSATRVYPNLLEYAKDGWYFSGSGSSFFRVL
jgi:4-diphosphocytidyl-2-C-methyl-D-erythritol kinase